MMFHQKYILPLVIPVRKVLWYPASATHEGREGPALAPQGVPAEDASVASILGRHEGRVARHCSINTFWSLAYATHEGSEEPAFTDANE